MNYQIQPTIKVIDANMGSGKTTYIINQLNNEKDRSKRFFIVTLYLNEFYRLMKAIPSLCLKSPNEDDPKSKELLQLI